MKKLDGRVAVVTGASYGVGKGVALGLAEAGAVVYATGRTIDGAAFETTGRVIAVRCDILAKQMLRRRFSALLTSGRVLVAAALAQQYGFTDIDGKQPRPLTLQDV